MPTNDAFDGLARFYDPLMQHVNYDRWHLVAGAVAELLPRPFRHLDAACGTGVLLQMLRKDGWRSFGLDLSPAMLHAGRRANGALRAVCADLRAVPVHGTLDYVTCLFDSVNFLLTDADLYAGIAQLAGALRPGGILYFDVVTERMVLDHFAGQEWTEKGDRMSSTWSCDYDRSTGTAATTIRVNRGEAHTLYERMYPLDTVYDAVARAGCTILGAHDAQNWKRPGRKTVRVDIVAVRGDARGYRHAFRGVQEFVQKALK
ncbi:MAG: class I SAM-dependent methyltransferase [Candidatus Hydrogenedentes bacterium]|nr:class I SAM-dependent methyltransferase [Candidatus Hydrogenedentota bacterium]